MAMQYDSAKWTAAHEKFLTDAKSLTDDDLEQLRIVDPTLAERARAKRAGFVERSTSTEDEKQFLAKTVTMRTLSVFFKDHW